MYALDPIDSLLAIYDNPNLKTEARADLNEDLAALVDHLEHIITTHIDTVTNRYQARTISACIVCRNIIGLYLNTADTKTGQG